MKNNKTILILSLISLPGCTFTTDYYVKNDTGVPINVVIDCGSGHEALAINANITAYFRTTRCNATPTLSVSAAGNRSKNVFKGVQSIPFESRLARLYFDKKGNVAYQSIALQDQEEPDGEIANYDLAL